MELKKDKKVLMITIITLTLILISGLSYAYFSAQASSTEQTVKTGKLEMTFDDSTEIINTSNIIPIKREEILTKATKKSFKVTNTGNQKMFVDISLEDIIIPTELQKYDFMWSLYEQSKNVSNGSFQIINNDKIKIGEYQVLEVDEEKTYNLYIWIEDTGIQQNEMMNREFKATIKGLGTIYDTNPESEFVFNLESGTITEYVGTSTNIIIPETINGNEVTKIGEMAFTNKNIKNIVIPNKVTRIGQHAFSNNELTSVVLPNSVTYIDSEAFESNKLTNVVIPNSVTTIKGLAFSSNNITNIVLPNTITYIDDNLIDDNFLTNVIIPNSVTSIGTYSFKNNKLINLVIPDNVTSIGEETFQDNPDLEYIIVKEKSTLAEFSSLGNDWNGICTNIIFQP